MCLALLIVSAMFHPAMASVTFERTRSDGFNFVIKISGGDLQRAQTISGALSIASQAADWIIATYFGNLNTAKQIEKAANTLGIPLPPAANLAVALLKAGLVNQIFWMIRAYASTCKEYLWIFAKAPPFPAQWYVARR
jgi:hypothetical protein